ncbi:unnamed protein product [Effrenium voratum]|nr:unnamed protein product [Effrenium voratum]
MKRQEAERLKQEELRRLEEERLALVRRQQEEEQRRQEMKRQEAERLKQEELRRLEEVRLAEERRQEEEGQEKRRQEDERLKQEELLRLDEERLAEDRRQQEEEQEKRRQEAERLKQEELLRLDEERLAEERRQQEEEQEKRRQEAERLKQEELRRLEEEQRWRETQKQQELRLLEKERLAEERRQQEEEQRRQEMQWQEAERLKQEELRLEEARLAEQRRQQEEQALQRERRVIGQSLDETFAQLRQDCAKSCLDLSGKTCDPGPGENDLRRRIQAEVWRGQSPEKRAERMFTRPAISTAAQMAAAEAALLSAAAARKASVQQLNEAQPLQPSTRQTFPRFEGQEVARCERVAPWPGPGHPAARVAAPQRVLPVPFRGDLWQGQVAERSLGHVRTLSPERVQCWSQQAQPRLATPLQAQRTTSFAAIALPQAPASADQDQLSIEDRLLRGSGEAARAAPDRLPAADHRLSARAARAAPGRLPAADRRLSARGAEPSEPGWFLCGAARRTTIQWRVCGGDAAWCRAPGGPRAEESTLPRRRGGCACPKEVLQDRPMNVLWRLARLARLRVKPKGRLLEQSFRQLSVANSGSCPTF